MGERASVDPPRSGRLRTGERAVEDGAVAGSPAPAALVIDGVPVCAVQEERLSRRKNDAAFPLAAIEWCLEDAGLAPDNLDAVVFYEKPMLNAHR